MTVLTRRDVSPPMRSSGNEGKNLRTRVILRTVNARTGPLPKMFP